MFKISLKGVLAHKTRLLLTALAVIMATAFLSSTYIFSDTIQRTFDELFADVFRNTDAFVRSSNVIEADFGAKQRDRLPDTITAEVAAVPGVVDAQAEADGFASIIGKDGDPLVSGQGAVSFGAAALTGELDAWTYVEGGPPVGPDQVVINKGAADKGDFAVGDQVRITSATGTREFTLSGIVKFGDADSPGGATFAIFDLPTAQEFVGKPGYISSVQVRGDGSQSDEQLARSIAEALGSESETEVLTGAEITEENQSDIQESLQFFTVFLNAVAFIALFVACFVIYNVFSITAAQRQRENALMRAIGASRRQVTASLLVESVVVGLVGSILGLALGMVLAMGLRAAFAALGLDLPSSGLTVLPRTVIVTVLDRLHRHRAVGADAGTALGAGAAGGGHAGHRARSDQRHQGPHDHRRPAAGVQRDAHPAGAVRRPASPVGARSAAAVHRPLRAGAAHRPPGGQGAGPPDRPPEGHDGHDGEGECRPQPEAHGPHGGRPRGGRRPRHRGLGAGLVDQGLGPGDLRRAVPGRLRGQCGHLRLRRSEPTTGRRPQPAPRGEDGDRHRHQLRA